MKPETERGCPVLPAQPLHDLHYNCALDNKLSALRAQYLREQFDLIGPRAGLVAALRWEQHNNV